MKQIYMRLAILFVLTIGSPISWAGTVEVKITTVNEENGVAPLAKKDVECQIFSAQGSRVGSVLRTTTGKEGEFSIKVPQGSLPAGQEEVSLEFSSDALGLIRVEHLLGTANHRLVLVMGGMAYAPKCCAEVIAEAAVYRGRKSTIHAVDGIVTIDYREPGTGRQLVRSLHLVDEDEKYTYYSDTCDPNCRWAIAIQPTCVVVRSCFGKRSCQAVYRVWLSMPSQNGQSKWRLYDSAMRQLSQDATEHGRH
jgi:hypothetical protein